ncbi:U21-ctenitoxin-Pn1a-like isoform X2 [Uloborus diversus]|uniref:U21-ctenitoxin-Pn1a-like isoform X1 n=1 Tax=Uloborus diversus TaxID=327109 RepID=UPI002409AE3A|nr:U21-ctenitoxin-Pn1a-like isoform X1 [Uloborus diversus]XP_054715007.1 U21-ctenitoxin-Pn1a-like isoform X2 [Uloborus diversus]
MKVLCVITLLCAAGYAVAKDPLTVPNCGKSFITAAPDRIVGGTTAPHGMYPWMVSLYERDGFWYHACGATILNDHWVVTAAHCIDFPNYPSSYKIYAGLHKQSDKYHDAVEVYDISDVFIHEHYDKRTNSNDIALLRTRDKINIAGSKGYINGICLPQDNSDPTGKGQICGWGHEWSSGRNSDVLKHATIPLVDRRTCNNAYDSNPYDDRDVILENMICGGSENLDTCQNDSGGPLSQRDSKGISTLVGITSFGRGCGMKGYPGVYTKVAYFRSWMTKTIQSRDPQYRS